MRQKKRKMCASQCTLTFPIGGVGEAIATDSGRVEATLKHTEPTTLATSVGALAGEEVVATKEGDNFLPLDLMERILSLSNVVAALERVKKNKGKPGVDGMTVTEVSAYFQVHGAKLYQSLLDGTYRPSPILRADIRKPDGGTRQLGIPTVIDRVIQQAVCQVLVPYYDPTFSEFSYGFRPGRNAHQALEQARQYVEEGYEWVVDMDLEKFFDWINHDILMSRLEWRIKDRRVLRLIRRYLQAGIMQDGLVSPRDKGAPQGGPLSPLLSNIMLDELDKELEHRGHRFCRYADDFKIYVRSERAGQRVLESVTKFVQRRLKLKVNQSKSGVGTPSERKFLSQCIIAGSRDVHLKIHKDAVKRYKQFVKRITRRKRGCKIEIVLEELKRVNIGWITYHRHTQSKSLCEKLDSWTRSHIRCYIWKQWKTKKQRAYYLRKAGMSPEQAEELANEGNNQPWRAAHNLAAQFAMNNNYLKERGFCGLLERFLKLNSPKIAGCGPACPVV